MSNSKLKAYNKHLDVWIIIRIGQIMTIESQKIYEKMCIDGAKWYRFTEVQDGKGNDIYEKDTVDIMTKKGEVYMKDAKIEFISGGFRAVTDQDSISLFRLVRGYGSIANRSLEFAIKLTQSPKS